MPAARKSRLTKSHYESLAGLRQALRRFLHFSQEAARGAGIPPQQHQALLALKGFPGREEATIGELAEQLHVKHHSVVGLVDRLVRRGLVRRGASMEDKRRVIVSLTARGEALIEKLSASHLAELRQMAPELRQWLDAM